MNIYIKICLRLAITLLFIELGITEDSDPLLELLSNTKVKPCWMVEKFALNDECITTEGSLIKRISFNGILGVEINKMFWSDMLAGSYTYLSDRSDVITNKSGEIGGNGNAELACEKIGLQLPTLDDYISLRSAFAKENPLRENQYYTDPFTSFGIKEFHNIMPNVKYHHFWIYTPFSYESPRIVTAFSGISGQVRRDTYRDWVHGVLCLH